MKFILCTLLVLFSFKVQAGFLSGYVVGTAVSETRGENKNTSVDTLHLPSNKGHAVIICSKAEGIEGFCQVAAREKILLTQTFKEEKVSIFIKRQYQDELNKKNFSKECALAFKKENTLPEHSKENGFRIEITHPLAGVFKLNCISTTRALPIAQYARESGYSDIIRIGVLLNTGKVFIAMEVSN